MTVSSPLPIKMKPYEQAQKILDNAELIFNAEEINQSMDKIATQLNKQFSHVSQPVIVLPVMNGGLILSGHLITRLKFPVEIDYCHATRYRDKTTGSDLHWKVKPQISLTNRIVLVVDDMLDEGHTLQSVMEFCKSQNVEKVLSAVLLEKIHPRPKADIKSDFVGLQVEDRYVFGFGMDYKGYHRQLNAIYAVSK